MPVDTVLAVLCTTETAGQSHILATNPRPQRSPEPVGSEAVPAELDWNPDPCAMGKHFWALQGLQGFPLCPLFSVGVGHAFRTWWISQQHSFSWTDVILCITDFFLIGSLAWLMIS